MTYEEKIQNLNVEDREKILEEFKKSIHFDDGAYLNTCVHCGLCADS